KNQSTNFDVQIAQTTITMIQYQLLSLKYRMEAYQTIGGMFRDVKQDIIEHKLNERIIAVISEILIVLDFIIDGLDLEETLSKLIYHSEKFTFLMNIENNKQSFKLVA
ncbi:MAG: IS4 family transposase, partial [Flavobacteriales bacterium]|nr:IS4 family transposase [Flavobacteriales bacterium]